MLIFFEVDFIEIFKLVFIIYPAIIEKSKAHKIAETIW